MVGREQIYDNKIHRKGCKKIKERKLKKVSKWRILSELFMTGTRSGRKSTEHIMAS